MRRTDAETILPDDGARVSEERNVRFSIVTATWNCVTTVGDCLDCLRAQTYKDAEHVVIDGASNDGTLELLRKRRSQIDVLVSERDQGIYDALNKGISRSTGDVVGFLHADDVYATTDVLSQVATAFTDPTVCAVFGDLEYVSASDVTKVVRHWRSTPFSPARLAWGWMPPHPTLFVRREWYSRIGGFDTRFRIAADYLSILRLFGDPAFKSVHLPKVLVKMRLGGASNRSIRSMVRKSHEDWCALRQTGVGAVGGVGALLWKNISKLGQFSS